MSCALFCFFFVLHSDAVGEPFLNYGIFLWPHANARYQAESARLGQAELEMMLSRVCPEGSVSGLCREDLPILEFQTPVPLTMEQIAILRNHSLMYELFELTGDCLRPVAPRCGAYLGYDLPAILKYKGKTNEQFSAMLLNAALFSSDFVSQWDQPLMFLDPICSRGTSLFLAVNRGWNADGSDLSAADIRELNQFFKKYLEYHKFKHRMVQKSNTLPQSKPVSVTEFFFADTPQAFQSGETRALRTAACDAAFAGRAFGKGKYHLMAGDLPYGVQHSAGSESFEKMLRRVMPKWAEALLPGGAIALSYNINTLKPALLRDIMTQSGLVVASGGPYDTLRHWVEQAVTRDIAVAVRPVTSKRR